MGTIFFGDDVWLFMTDAQEFLHTDAIGGNSPWTQTLAQCFFPDEFWRVHFSFQPQFIQQFKCFFVKF